MIAFFDYMRGRALADMKRVSEYVLEKKVHIMRKQLIVTAVIALFAISSSAQTVWVGGTSSDYLDASNWSAGLPQLNTIDGIINSDGFATLAGTSPSVELLTINGRLDVNTGGSLLTENGSKGIKVGAGTGESGTLNIAAGGIVTTTGASVDLLIGDSAGGQGFVNVNSGGKVDPIKAIEVINGQLTFAADALSIPGFKDEFVVDNNGVLAFQTDGSAIATVHGNTGSFSRTAELGANSTLDMQLGGPHSIGDSWVVMDNILSFTGVSGGDGTGIFGTVTNTLNPADVFTVEYSGGSVTVTLGSGTPYNGPEILSFTTSESSVLPGTPVTLDWSVSNATYVSLNQGIGEVAPNGSTDIVVTASTTFTLTATNASDSAGENISINVLPARSPASSGPNIVFVLVDDWGWTDHSNSAVAGGHQSDFYQTPNFERLVEAGVAFTSTYAQPNCAPTRAALLSGQYSCRTGNGVYNVSSLSRSGTRTTYTTAANQGDEHANGDEQSITIAEAFVNSGYVTAHFGKYHAGSGNPADPTFPLNQGFDYNYGGGNQGNPGSYWSDGTSFNGNMNGAFDAFAADYSSTYIASNLISYANGNDPATLEGTSKHLTDATADAFTSFMNEHQSGSLSNYPVYVQFHFYAVHTPTHGRPDLVAKYAGLPDGTYHDHNAYAALIEGMDHSLGRIMDYLDDPNGDGDRADSIASNTLVIFCSDNGGQNPTDNTPLRGVKGMHYEGGIRIPCVISMPGTIPTNKVSDTLVHVVDFYPTMLDFAAGVYPDSIGHPLDGVSLYDHLLDPEHTSRDREPVFYHFPGYMDARAYACSVCIKDVGGKRYKYIYAYDPYYDPGTGYGGVTRPFDQYQLYNLTDDIGETVNLLDYINLDPAKNPSFDTPTAADYWNYILHKDIANELAADLNHWLVGDPEDTTWNPIHVTYKSNYPGIGPGLIGQAAGPSPASVPDLEIPEEVAFKIMETLPDDLAGKVTLTYRSETGFVYDVQACSNLVESSWQTITNDVPGQAGTTTVSNIPDPEILTESHRFYRANVRSQ